MEISELPDCLLIDIISRLPTTKEAIRTSTLSKRWQHLWPYVHDLCFTNHNYYKNDAAFYEYVDKILAQCRHSDLNKFKICINLKRIGFKPKISTWIRYAVTHNVQDLHLSLRYLKHEIKLDESFFINSCLTHLKLKGFKFNQVGEISWRNLKSLYVYDANLNEGLIQSILSGSPQLETLVLDWCNGFRRVDISSRSVKKFVFSGYRGDEHVIEINTPYLLSLTIRDGMYMSKILLLNVTSLVKAELYYGKGYYAETLRKEAEEEMLKGLLLNLSHVKELTLFSSFMSQALSRLEAKGFTLPLNMTYPDIISHSFWEYL